MNQNILFLRFKTLVYAGNFFGALDLVFFLVVPWWHNSFHLTCGTKEKSYSWKGIRLKGNIKYDLQQDLVQYGVADQRTTAFSARKVLFFEIFDTSVRKYRQFFALPLQRHQDTRRRIF
jgi:hypothetical protein